MTCNDKGVWNEKSQAYSYHNIVINRLASTMQGIVAGQTSPGDTALSHWKFNQSTSKIWMITKPITSPTEVSWKDYLLPSD